MFMKQAIEHFAFHIKIQCIYQKMTLYTIIEYHGAAEPRHRRTVILWIVLEILMLLI